MEEFVKYTIIMRQHFDLFNDRHSERMEKQAKADKLKAEEAAAAEKAGKEGNAKTMDSATVVNGVDVGGL
jgi:arsenic resistance protein ArsH